MEVYEEAQVKLRHPFRALVYGVSGAGKSVWVAKCVRHMKHVVDIPIRNIVYCYSEYQDAYDELLPYGVEFVHGLPSEDMLDKFSHSNPTFLIIDDLMGNISQLVCDLFTKYSHHRSISLAYLVQNLFPKDPFSRTVSLNSNVMVLFANPRDKTQVSILAKQIYPGETKVLLEAFKHATASKSHGYLLVDLQKDTPDKLRLRTNLFPGEGVQYVYVKNN
jgi:hypothetical protein